MKIDDWLLNLGLSEYISIFKENEITFDDLHSLTSEDLKTELGITKLIDRKKIIQAISELNLNETSSEKLSNYLEVKKIPFCLFEPFHEFKKEKHPRVKLFWLIDTSEYAIKFIVSILFAEILRLNNGELPETLKIKIRDHIERPTLGKWLGILAELSNERTDLKSLFNELFKLNSNTINEKFKTENLGGNIENSILVLRNQLAHGGGMSSEKAKLLVDIFERQVCEIINSISKALENSSMIAKNGVKCFDIFCNEIMEVPIPDIIKNCSDGVWLINNDSVLNLSPITVFEPIQQGTNGGEMIKKLKPSLQVYARSNRDKLVYSPIGCDEALSENFEIDKFKKMFGLDAERNKTKSDQKNADFLWDDFIREARLASEDLVGRNDEIKAIKAWLKSRDSFNAEIPKSSWIYGGPGLGKSLLISKIVSDYCNSSSKYKGFFYFRFRGGDARNNRISFLKYFKNALLAWEPLTPFIDTNYLNETSDVSELVLSIKHIINQIVKIENDNLKSPKPCYWIFVDGIDEIIGSDRSIVAMFYELVLPGTIWTFSGRPENNLNETFKIHNADFIFQKGLPLLSENDIREMLIDGLGKIKYDLLKLDLDENNGIENAFIQKVIEKAQGLPIYVSLLIRDLCSGQYKITADTILPNGLSEYYNLVLDRIGLSSVKRDLPIIIAILSIVDEPLDSDALTILLANNISEDFDFYRKRVDEAIKVGGSLLRIAPTSYNTNGWTLYHQSFRDHVNGSLNKNHNPLHDVVIESKRLICRITESWENLNKSTLKTHLFQYGNSYDIEWRDHGKFYALGRLTDLKYILIRLAELNNYEIFKIVNDLEITMGLLVIEIFDGVSGFGVPAFKTCHIETFTKFFRERAHIISLGTDEWGSDKIALQLALEYAKNSKITLEAKKILTEKPIKMLTKAFVPDDPVDGMLYRTLKFHESEITGVVALDDYNQILSWDKKNFICIWNIHTGACSKQFKLNIFKTINNIFAIQGGGYLIFADNKISRWNINKSEPIYIYDIDHVDKVEVIVNEITHIKYQDDSGATYDKLPTFLPNFQSNKYKQVSVKTNSEFIFAYSNDCKLYVLGLEAEHTQLEFQFESSIKKLVCFGEIALCLTSNGFLNKLNINFNQKIESIILNSPLDLYHLRDSYFVLSFIDKFQILSLDSFSIIYEKITENNIIAVNDKRYLISTRLSQGMWGNEKSFVDIFDLGDLENINLINTLLPLGGNRDVGDGFFSDIYCADNKLILTYWDGVLGGCSHINIYDIIAKSDKIIELNQLVGRNNFINGNILVLKFDDKISLINIKDEIVSYEISINKYNWNESKCININNDFISTSNQNGLLSIYRLTSKNESKLNFSPEITSKCDFTLKSKTYITYETLFMDWMPGGNYNVGFGFYKSGKTVNAQIALNENNSVELIYVDNIEETHNEIININQISLEHKIAGESLIIEDVEMNLLLKWYSINGSIDNFIMLPDKSVLVQHGTKHIDLLTTPGT